MSQTKHRYWYSYALSFAVFITALLSTQAFAKETATDLIHQGTAFARANLLKSDTHRYLDYFQDGESTIPLDIRTRTVRFETRDGKNLMQIKLRWDGVGRATYTKWIDSWFEAKTFVPLTQERITEKDGNKIVEGFIFHPDRIIGMPDLANNTQKDLLVKTAEPAFNFETDIEMLQTLPFETGYQANIMFYHPGGKTEPARYLFKVIGSEMIYAAGSMIDCWVVSTDYNSPNSLARFWFAKNSQLLVKKESGLPNGKKIVQVLLD